METILTFHTSTGRARTEALAGIREFASSAGWHVQPFEYEGSPFPVRDLVRFWNPIGCIAEISGSAARANALPPRMLTGLPTVYLGSNPLLSPARATRVIHDADGTAQFATREFLAHGIGNFAYVGFRSLSWCERRLNAFHAALKLHGKPLETLALAPSGDREHAQNPRRLKSWLKKLPRPCGLLAADDSLGETVLSVCRLAGIAVPDDLAVIGVDDNEQICDHTTPTLSSIRPDFRQGGRLAARLLARKILRPFSAMPAETVFRMSGLVRRGSSRFLRLQDSAVAAALERIHAAGSERLSPHELLADFPCSRRAAEIRFRKATGRSVLEELMLIRIERAKDLLRTTDLPIPAVAERCGYSFPSRFREAFRAATGRNPLAWRKDATPRDP